MGLCGMPPPNGAIPQSPMHTRSLQGVGQDRADLTKASIVLENRVSNVIQSLLVGLCMFISPVITLMPRAVLWGYFIFMAIQAFPGGAVRVERRNRGLTHESLRKRRLVSKLFF